MAPRAAMRSALALGLGAAVGLAGSAFVVAPGAGRLQTQSLAHSEPRVAAAGASATSSAGLLAACSAGAALVAAGFAAARRSGVARAAAPITETIPRPEDLLESPKFPLFHGSAGGYMSKATRERHAITWTAKSEEIFEMPTGGWAIMNKGENLCYFRKKEQCIALGKELRKLKIENYKVYRIQKDGTVLFLHPADGVFPEKVNKGRVQVNGRPFTVAMNPQPGNLRFTKYHLKSYEADALTTLFVRARMAAWDDTESLFPLPQPTDWIPVEKLPEVNKEQREKLLKEGLLKLQEQYKSL